MDQLKHINEILFTSWFTVKVASQLYIEILLITLAGSLLTKTDSDVY